MSKDYAKIPTHEHRTNHSTSKYSGHLILIIIGLIGVIFYYAFSRGILVLKTDVANVTQNNAITHHHTLPKNQPIAAPVEKPKPRFEFYTVLSKETVPISNDNNDDNNEKNVAADVTTNTIEIQAKPTKPLAEPEPALAPTGVPSVTIHPVNKGNVANTQHVQPSETSKIILAQPKLAPPKLAPVVQAIPVPSVPAPAVRYILQVAALQHTADIDRLKAQLSFLGFDVNTESFQSNGSTWYRIKVGPYASATEMQKARQILLSNHLGSIIVTLPAK